MKKNLLLWSVLMGSLIGFTSCSDDDKFVEPTKPTLDGTDIEIGAVAGYEPMKSTRTIYPGQEVELTPDKRIEKINWVLGDEYTGKDWLSDEIQVYSPEALPTNAGNQWAQYKLVAHSETNPSLAIYPGDSPSDGGNTTPGGATPSQSYTDEGKFHVTGDDPSGLKWNPKEGTHYFYAVYPSANLNPSVKLEKRAGDIYFNGKISPFQATVGYMKDPSASIPTYMAMPVMRQNYMWAVHASTEAEKIDNSIGLDFRTIPTSLELDLVWPSSFDANNYSIKSVRLSYVNGIQNENICGEFEANLSSASEATDSSDRVYPTVTAIEQPGVSNNSIEINLDADPLHQKSGIQLNPGEHLKVRFLMLPHQEWDGANLRLTIIGEKGQLSHMLAGTTGAFTLKPHKLNRIKNIPLPKTFDVTNWISQVPDNVMLSQLSIPGTGSSYLHTPTNPTVYAQSKTVEEQWNMGIRCFDITVADNADSGVKSFGDAHIRIDNNTEIDVTVGQAFTKLLDNVKQTNPDGEPWKGEFGMMIVRYQPKGTRYPDKFIYDFEEYFKTLQQDRICLYQPSLTVGEARGKIMVILCPTSEGEDDLKAYQATMTNYLMVNGCGSLPDKFYKRGYSYDGVNQVLDTCANKVAESNRYQTAEYYIYNNQAANLSILSDMVNFTYETNQDTFNAYMQDWLRVIDGTTDEVNTFTNVGFYVYNNPPELKHTQNVQWRSSYKEKYDNVVNTFEKAVADKDHANLVYINSLCGFLASEQNRTDLKYKYGLEDALVEGQFVPISNGYWPAVSGNIKALSDKLNPAFYKYVYDQLRSGTVKGPMGVVLMNFVGDKDSHGSDLLPSMVISNNFSFPLKTGTPGTNPDPGTDPNTPKDDPMPGADGSYDAGGWLWGDK